MKQIEITVKVYSSLEEASAILEKIGFKKIRESRVEDTYLTQNKQRLNKKNILEVLSSCVLLRYLKINDKETFRKITYKRKEYKNNQVVSEEKINLDCENLKDAKRLFEALKFEKLVDVNYDVVVFEKDGLELAFQNVEKLGLLLEFENLGDFTNVSTQKIIEEKQKMITRLKNFGLKVSEDFDVKKAFELVSLELD